MSENELYFEDINEGDSIPDLVKEPVTRVQLVKYAGASGDFNPLHTVEDFAKKAGFDQPIAHGMLSMAFVGQVLTDWLPPGALKKLGSRFTAVTFPGDTVTCKGRVVRKYQEGGENLIEIEVWAETQNGTKTVQGSAVAALPSRG
jgi:acyl dehydratase